MDGVRTSIRKTSTPIPAATRRPPLHPQLRRAGLVEILRRCQRARVWLDVLTDVHSDDVGTFLRHPHCVCAALTTGRAGNERDLSLETVHQTPVNQLNNLRI